MILADKLTEVTAEARELLFDSRILRFHKDVYDMALELVAKDTGQIERIAPFICWPDHDTWIEVDTGGGKRFGFLYQADRGRDTTTGRGMLVLDDRPGEPAMWLPVRYDLPNFKMRWFDPRSELQAKLDTYPAGRAHLPALILRDIQHGGDAMLDSVRITPVLNSFKPILFAMLALINSPKLVTQRLIDVTKLNRARAKKGKPLFHPHHEVRLNVDSLRINITRGLGDGPKREEHFVRAHPRFLVHRRYKNVSVVMIPPHYRGDPKIGTRYTEYRVDKAQSNWSKNT